MGGERHSLKRRQTSACAMCILYLHEFSFVFNRNPFPIRNVFVIEICLILIFRLRFTFDTYIGGCKRNSYNLKANI